MASKVGFRRVTRHRKNGESYSCYEYRFTIDGERHSVYGNTQKECREKEAKKRKAINEGYIDNSSLTLSEYYKEWQSRRTGEIKPSTKARQDERFKCIKKSLGRKKLQKIEVRQIESVRRQLLADGHNSQGTNDIMDLLRSIMNSAVNDRIIAFNPCNGIKRLKRTEKHATETIHRALAEDELLTFLEYAKDSYYYNFFRILAYTGMRTGEAAALTWADIDYTNGVIHINKTAVKIYHDYIVQSPKTDKGFRDVPITPIVKEVLQAQFEAQKILNGGSVVYLSGTVFPTSNHSGYVTASNLCPVIKHILKNAEKDNHHIDYFSAHALRDTYATRCTEQGMSAHTLMKLLGHSNINLTMNLYAQALPETIKTAAEKIVFKTKIG